MLNLPLSAAAVSIQFSASEKKQITLLFPAISLLILFTKIRKGENMSRMTRVAYGILYDMDEDDLQYWDEYNLPTTMEIPDYVPDDGIADYISDQTGWCVSDFSINVRPKKAANA